MGGCGGRRPAHPGRGGRRPAHCRGGAARAVLARGGRARRHPAPRVGRVPARLIAGEGPPALSLRRLAAAAGGSTQLVYTLFGGKPGLADALYAEGFRRLGGAMRTALAQASPPVGDPARLLVLAQAY